MRQNFLHLCLQGTDQLEGFNAGKCGKCEKCEDEQED